MAKNRIDSSATQDNGTGTVATVTEPVQTGPAPVSAPATVTVADLIEQSRKPAHVRTADMTVDQIYEQRSLDGTTTVRGKAKTEFEGRSVKLSKVVSHEGNAPVLAALTAGGALSAGRTTKRGNAVISDRVTFSQYEAACVVAKLLGMPCPPAPHGHPDYVPPAQS